MGSNDFSTDDFHDVLERAFKIGMKRVSIQYLTHCVYISKVLIGMFYYSDDHYWREFRGEQKGTGFGKNTWYYYKTIFAVFNNFIN